MKSLILALALVQNPSPIQQAQDLYTEGTAAYDSADYSRAIELFTESLALTPSLPESEAKPIRLQLLYNIARAHEMAFDIDKDVTHLRQARTLYKRYADEISDPGDSLDAEMNLGRIDKKLQMLQQIDQNREAAAKTKPVPPPPVAFKQDKRKRNVGIGLLSGGGIVTVTGVAVLAAGATLKTKAEREINDVTGGDPMHEAWNAGQVHIQNEAQRGRVFVGIGSVIAAAGLTSVVVGAIQVKKSKQHIALTPTFNRAFAGLTVSGRF